MFVGGLWKGAGLCLLLPQFWALACRCTLAGHLVDTSEDAQDQGAAGAQEKEPWMTRDRGRVVGSFHLDWTTPENQ